MKLRKKMTEEDLVSIIDSHISSNKTYATKIAIERANAIKAYHSQLYGNEKKGRSSYVSSDVKETISWALPQIMKVFERNDGIVKFDPVSPEGIQDAELATEYCDYIFKKVNNGFYILYTFIFDALLQKNAVVKVYIDTTKEYIREEYNNLSDLEVAALLQNDDIEPIERETNEVEMVQMDPLTGEDTVVKQRTHNIVVKKLKNNGKGKIKIDNIPPEEIIVSKHTTSLNLDESPFVGHKVKKTISWLRSQGYKVEDDISDMESDNDDAAFLARQSVEGSYITTQETDNTNPASRLVNVVEAYIQVDFNNDGINEWRKVVKVGNKVLENEECYMQPFISTSPNPLPHKYFGLSLADLVMDLQKLKSMVMRAVLDGYAFNLSPTKAVDVNKLVDINDLLQTGPGAWIKTRGNANEAIAALPSAGIGQEAFGLLEYIDNITESRSGVSRFTQGIDSNAFNKTATGTQAIMNASQEKLALITRLFAETGLAEIYKKIIKLSSMFIKEEQLIQAGSQFLTVDPKRWTNLETLTVNVGTGAIDNQAAGAQAQQILQMQTQLLQAGRPDLMAMVDVQKIYNAGANILKSMGRKNVADYFNPPDSQAYQQNMQLIMQNMPKPQPDPLIATAQIQAQASIEKAKQDAMLKSAEFQYDVSKSEKEQQLKELEVQLKYQVELEKLKQKKAEQEYTALKEGIAQVADMNGESQFVSQNDLNAIHRTGFEQQSQINAAILEGLAGVKNEVQGIAKHMTAPKQIIYDEQGNPIGSRTIMEDQ